MLKKFNIEYVKKNPVMFGVIIIVFGLLVWLLLNRGSSGSGGGDVIYQSAGTDPAKLAAETQIATATIQAQAMANQGQMQLAALGIQGQNDLALASLSAQIAAAQLGAEERLGEKGIVAQLELARLDRLVNQDNQAAQIAYQQNQNNMTIELSKQQAAAFQLSSLLSVLPSLKKKNRDETLQFIAAGTMGTPATLINGPVGTGTTIRAQTPSYALPPPTIN